MSTSPVQEASRAAETRSGARRQFDQWALSYDRSWLNELVFFPSARTCQEEILRWQMERGTDEYRLLDVGCGTGTLLMMLAHDRKAERLVGLDYSAVMLERFSAKADQCPARDKLFAVNADSGRLPFADACFDVVTCCNSFHHYPDQAASVSEFKRVLRPGGMLVLIDGFRDNVVGWVVFDVMVGTLERNVHHASWSRVRSLLERSGFSRVRQRKMNVLAPLLVSVAIA